MKKYRTLKWLNKNIAKTPQCQCPPKWINFLRRIFYPFQTSYERQSGIRYDIEQDQYFIEGIEISRKLLMIIKKINHNENLIDSYFNANLKSKFLCKLR